MASAAQIEQTRDDVSTFLERDTRDFPHALIAFGSSRHSPLLWVASRVAFRLTTAGFVVDIGDASARAMPTPLDYDVVVAGLSGRWRYDRSLLDWIHLFGRELCLSTAGAFVLGPPTHSVAKLAAFGWNPLTMATVPDHRREAVSAAASIDRFAVRLLMLFRAQPEGPSDD